MQLAKLGLALIQNRVGTVDGIGNIEQKYTKRKLNKLNILTSFTEFVSFTILVGTFEVTIIAGACIASIVVHITVSY